MNTLKNKLTILVILVSILFAGQTNFMFAQVFVDHSATGANDGTSWENAYTNLSQAIKNTSSGEIWVSQGVYLPTLNLAGESDDDIRQLTFPLKPGVAMYGGFLGGESTLEERSWEENLTILDGNVGADDPSDNSNSVITSLDAQLNEQTVLDGFTIRNGNASQGDQVGGAIRISQGYEGKFVVRNCLITENESRRGGGAVYIHNADPTFENITFKSNKGGEGGDIYLSTSRAIIRFCEFRNSSSGAAGGSIYVSSYSSPVIKNNLFHSNQTGGEGGAIKLATNYYVVVEANKFIGNSASLGGGVFVDSPNVFFFNNIFGENEARDDGGALHMDYVGGIAKFINNTVSNNSANRGGGLYLRDANLSIINSIIYGNTASEGDQVHLTEVQTGLLASFNYNNIQGGEDNMDVTIVSDLTLEYENNVDILPSLSDQEENIFETLAISEMIDLGTYSSDFIPSSWSVNEEEIVFPDVDLLGQARVFNGLIDIGAIEIQTSKQYKPTSISLSNSQVSQSAEIGTKIGDLNTEDPDSQSFTYHINNNNCFSIQDSSLKVGCDLIVFEESPINLSITSTDSDGWSVTQEFDLELTDIVPDVVAGVEEDLNKTIKIFPNPSNGLFNILFQRVHPVSINVIDLNGNSVISFNLNPDDDSIDMRQLRTGVYILFISVNGVQYEKKVVIGDH